MIATLKRRTSCIPMIFEVLKQLLGEFFVGVEEHNVSFYAGDLFGRLLSLFFFLFLNAKAASSLIFF